MSHDEIDFQCIGCGISLGSNNPRQFCEKTHCPSEGLFVLSEKNVDLPDTTYYPYIHEDAPIRCYIDDISDVLEDIKSKITPIIPDQLHPVVVPTTSIIQRIRILNTPSSRHNPPVIVPRLSTRRKNPVIFFTPSITVPKISVRRKTYTKVQSKKKRTIKKDTNISAYDGDEDCVHAKK